MSFKHYISLVQATFGFYTVISHYMYHPSCTEVRALVAWWDCGQTADALDINPASIQRFLLAAVRQLLRSPAIVEHIQRQGIWRNIDFSHFFLTKRTASAPRVDSI